MYSLEHVRWADARQMNWGCNCEDNKNTKCVLCCRPDLSTGCWPPLPPTRPLDMIDQPKPVHALSKCQVTRKVKTPGNLDVEKECQASFYSTKPREVMTSGQGPRHARLGQRGDHVVLAFFSLQFSKTDACCFDYGAETKTKHCKNAEWRKYNASWTEGEFTFKCWSSNSSHKLSLKLRQDHTYKLDKFIFIKQRQG